MLENLPCFMSFSITTFFFFFDVRIIVEKVIYFSFISFSTFLVGLKLTYSLLVFGTEFWVAFPSTTMLYLQT